MASVVKALAAGQTVSRVRNKNPIQ
jgi:hypothetical protein